MLCICDKWRRDWYSCLPPPLNISGSVPNSYGMLTTLYDRVYDFAENKLERRRGGTESRECGFAPNKSLLNLRRSCVQICVCVCVCVLINKFGTRCRNLDAVERRHYYQCHRCLRSEAPYQPTCGNIALTCRRTCLPPCGRWPNDAPFSLRLSSAYRPAFSAAVSVARQHFK